jgi:hypothetical protein
MATPFMVEASPRRRLRRMHKHTRVNGTALVFFMATPFMAEGLPRSRLRRMHEAHEGQLDELRELRDDIFVVERLVAAPTASNSRRPLNVLR